MQTSFFSAWILELIRLNYRLEATLLEVSKLLRFSTSEVSENNLKMPTTAEETGLLRRDKFRCHKRKWLVSYFSNFVTYFLLLPLYLTIIPDSHSCTGTSMRYRCENVRCMLRGIAPVSATNFHAKN